MKKLSLILLILIGLGLTSIAQIDTDQLSLDISKADAANTEQLKEFLWKRVAVATVDGVTKLTATADLSFDENGKVQAQVTDAETDVKQKRGVRGKIQASGAQSSLDYVQDALNLAIAYTYMTKGQLLDFFGKAKITEKDGIITAAAGDVLMNGDSLTVSVESDTKLFINKKFSSLLGEDKDPISGEIPYEKFSSGVMHATGSVLTLPAKKAVINAKNQDYSKRVQ